METMNTPAPESFDVDLEDQAREAAFTLLLAEGIDVLSIDDGYVECPGAAFHTTPTADSDCKVFFNIRNNVLIPRLHCFHSSCRDFVQKCNQRLYQKVFAMKPWRRLAIPTRLQAGEHRVLDIAKQDLPVVNEVLYQYPWTYRDIVNDAPESERP